MQFTELVRAAFVGLIRFCCCDRAELTEEDDFSLDSLADRESNGIDYDASSIHSLAGSSNRTREDASSIVSSDSNSQSSSDTKIEDISDSEGDDGDSSPKKKQDESTFPLSEGSKISTTISNDKDKQSYSKSGMAPAPTRSWYEIGTLMSCMLASMYSSASSGYDAPATSSGYNVFSAPPFNQPYSIPALSQFRSQSAPSMTNLSVINNNLRSIQYSPRLHQFLARNVYASNQLPPALNHNTFTLPRAYRYDSQRPVRFSGYNTRFPVLPAQRGVLFPPRSSGYSVPVSSPPSLYVTSAPAFTQSYSVSPGIPHHSENNYSGSPISQYGAASSNSFSKCDNSTPAQLSGTSAQTPSSEYNDPADLSEYNTPTPTISSGYATSSSDRLSRFLTLISSSQYGAAQSSVSEFPTTDSPNSSSKCEIPTPTQLSSTSAPAPSSEYRIATPTAFIGYGNSSSARISRFLASSRFVPVQSSENRSPAPPSQHLHYSPAGGQNKYNSSLVLNNENEKEGYRRQNHSESTAATQKEIKPTETTKEKKQKNEDDNKQGDA